VKQAAGLDETRLVRNRQAAWLRVYLGYAPGVGKTYAMLHEGRRRRDRGTDVVVGWVQTYDRPHTVDAVGDLEIVPPRALEYRGQVLHEMDVDAVIARQPQVALVDELAHTNVPGSKHLKRYQDVVDLREYGINVITTVNIQHLASLHETVQLLAGVTVAETLPDWVLEAADELEMVDYLPEALRKRLRRGNVQPKAQVERALEGFFRIDTLTALRELTLQRKALHTQRKLQPGGALHGFSIPAASTETVLVGVLRGDAAQVLVRRGVHLADRLRGRLIVLQISEPGGGLQSDASRGHQETVKALQLARALGAEVHTVIAYSRVSDTLVQFASDVGASQIVLGEGPHSWFRELIGDSIVRDVLRRTSDVDVHIVRRAER
jgi:two-component system, OmpR family, sensor histidine kinase KdpD